MSAGDRERPWWASDARDGEQQGAGEAPGDAPPWPHGDGEVCQVCPICAFLRVVGDTRPEVMEHLVEAAHHLTLAAKAVVDAHAEGFARDGGLEHIELDDD